MQAKITSTYVLSAGGGSPNSPPELIIDGNVVNALDDVYTVNQTNAVEAWVGDKNHSDLQYTVEVRAFMVTNGQGEEYGERALQDFSIGLEMPTAC